MYKSVGCTPSECSQNRHKFKTYYPRGTTISARVDTPHDHPRTSNNILSYGNSMNRDDVVSRVQVSSVVSSDRVISGVARSVQSLSADASSDVPMPSLTKPRVRSRQPRLNSRSGECARHARHRFSARHWTTIRRDCGDWSRRTA